MGDGPSEGRDGRRKIGKKKADGGGVCGERDNWGMMENSVMGFLEMRRVRTKRPPGRGVELWIGADAGPRRPVKQAGQWRKKTARE